MMDDDGGSGDRFATSLDREEDAAFEYVDEPWWVKSYLFDYALILLLGAATGAVALGASPRLRFITQGDPSLSYPFTEHETCPVWLLMLLTLPLPVLVVIGVLWVQKTLRKYPIRRQYMQLHHYLVTMGLTLLITLFVTVCLKFGVGRYRPDYFSRDTNNAHLMREGHLSFPSGHSSQAFSALVLLALWLAGQLKLFHRAFAWKVFAVFAPISLALWIGASRLIDYRHHFSDVAFGAGLGSGVAVVIYLTFYHWGGKKSGQPRRRSAEMGCGF